jgi:Heterokaryon incompatibility protein Het-C
MTLVLRPRCKTLHLLENANPRDLRHAPAHTGPLEDQLRSTIALDQITALAKRCTPEQFTQTMPLTFGFDIPQHTYLRLYKTLLAGEVLNPELQLTRDTIYPAEYDNQARIIRIHPAALEHVLGNPDTTWELLAILLHEFGHHLDNVLRKDLADRHLDGSSAVVDDSPLEEGSRHAYRMAFYEALNVEQGDVEIATYYPLGAEAISISAHYSNAMRQVRQTQHDDRTHTTDGSNESFEAGAGGKGHFTHASIEEILSSLGFIEDEVNAIYFGNWLRDYSQLLDPKIVRAGDMPKNFPDVLSRDALTRIVDVLAVRKFTWLRRIAPDLFTVTPDLLGVYRPSEHIDNPKVLNPKPADPRTRDADFEPWVLPHDALLEVDAETSTKAYIQRSVEFMRAQLKRSMTGGRNYKNHRSFGAALHILEDFFAHSNFVELSLIKAGYTNVLPWTSKADCKWELPLVTGMFGATDVVASLAAPVGEILFSTKDTGFEPTQAGHRSERDQVMLILLSEHQDPVFLEIFEKLLATRDQWAHLPFSEYVEKFRWITGTPARLLTNAFATVMQGALKVLGNSIDDVQTLVDDNPNISGSTDPSHSQLAKDHAEHPLHLLAATLAKEAVMRVAQAMLGYWEGKEGVDPIAVATAYFVHPMDSSWQDQTVAQWARDNPSLVRRSTLKSELDTVQHRLKDAQSQALRRLAREGEDLAKVLSGDGDVLTLMRVLGGLTRSPLERVIELVIDLVAAKK